MDEKIITELAAAVMLHDLSDLADDFEKIERAIMTVVQSDIADIGGFSGEPQVSASVSPDVPEDSGGNTFIPLRSDEKNEHDGRKLISSYAGCDGEYNSVPRVV